MLGIAWRVLRRQPGALLGPFLMITLGAGLLGAFSISADSVSATRAPVERYHDTPVVAGGQSGVFTPEMVQEVDRLPGVREAVPELAFPANVVDRDGDPVAEQEETARFGHSWTSAKLTPFTVAEGGEPARGDEVVLDRALAEDAEVSVGDRVEILVSGTVHDYRLAGIAEPAAGGGSLTHQRALFFTPERAAELAGRGDGRVDGIGVMTEPDADPATTAAAVHRVLDESLAGDLPSPSATLTMRVAAGPERGELEASLPDHRASGQVMTVLVWVVAFMATAVISGAMVTAVRRRSRQFALLRAVGATPGQVRRLCLAEALLLSAVAAVAGSALATFVAWLLLEGFRALGLLSTAVEVSYRIWPIAAAGGITIAIGQVAAWVTARAALRIRPAEALAAAPTNRPPRDRTKLRVVTGVLALGGAGISQTLGMAGQLPPGLRDVSGMVANGLVILGVGMLGSWIIFWIARMVRLPVGRLSRVGGYLAAANVGFASRRYSGVATPLAVGVAIAGWALSGLPLVAMGAADDIAQRFDADYFLRTPIVREAPLGLGEEVRQEATNVTGVTAAVGIRETWGSARISRSGADTEGREADSTRAMVVTGQPSGLLDLRETRGDLDEVDNGVAVGTTYARQQGIDLGDEVEVRVTGASHPATLPVVALFDRDRGGENGMAVSASALSGHVADLRHDFVLAATGPAAGPRTAAELNAIDEGTGHTTVEDESEFREGYVAERKGAIDNLGTVATVLVGVFLVIAAVNALALAAADRSAELTAMRRLGVAPRQIGAMVTWEMVLTVGPAWVLGTAAALWMALAIAGGDVAAAVWAFPEPVLLGLGAFGLITAVLGARATTRATLRNR